MSELSIRHKRTNTLEVQVKMDTRNVSSVVDCYISNRWIHEVQKFWQKAARHNLAIPYRSLNVVSFPQPDMLPPKKEAQVQPELKLLATQMALTKQSNAQDLCTLESPSKPDAWGQQVVGSYRNPRYSHDIQIVALGDMEKKYPHNGVRSVRRSMKRAGAPIQHVHRKRR